MGGFSVQDPINQVILPFRNPTRESKSMIEQARMHELLKQMVGDMGAAAVAPLVILGDKLGLYRVLAG